MGAEEEQQVLVCEVGAQGAGLLGTFDDARGCGVGALNAVMVQS